MPTLPPTPREGLTSRAYQHLRYHLSIGSFAPGQRLKRRDLAAAMAMSLTPVREALGQLVTEGVLLLAERRSVRVPLLDAATYLEIAHLRCVLEGRAAEAAARLASAEEIDDRAPSINASSTPRSAPTTPAPCWPTATSTWPPAGWRACRCWRGWSTTCG